MVQGKLTLKMGRVTPANTSLARETDMESTLFQIKVNMLDFYKDGKRNGEGILTGSDGEKYAGDFY